MSGNLGCGILNYSGNVAIYYSTIAYNDEHCQIGNLGTVFIANWIVAGLVSIQCPGSYSRRPHAHQQQLLG